MYKSNAVATQPLFEQLKEIYDYEDTSSGFLPRCSATARFFTKDIDLIEHDFDALIEAIKRRAEDAYPLIEYLRIRDNTDDVADYISLIDERREQRYQMSQQSVVVDVAYAG